MKQSIVSPSYIKQVAKKLKKDKGISHTEALEEAVKLHGYSNYKHYLNELETNRDFSNPATAEVLKSISIEKDHSKRVDLAVTFLHKGKMPFKDILEVLSQFQKSKKDIQYLCDQSILEGEIRRFLLGYFVESKEDIQALPLMDFFVAKNVVVKHFRYELRKNKLLICGDYTLELQFEHEVPDEMKDLPHFRRGPMFGNFEITIDKNNKIIVEELDIGEETNADGTFWMQPFKMHPEVIAGIKRMREQRNNSDESCKSPAVFPDSNKNI